MSWNSWGSRYRHKRRQAGRGDIQTGLWPVSSDHVSGRRSLRRKERNDIPGCAETETENDRRRRTVIPGIDRDRLQAEDASLENLWEELGDLLFHILFLARLAEEAQEVGMEDILEGITEKMIRHHPHVFWDTSVSDAGDVRACWERIKTEVEHKTQRNFCFPIGELPPSA